MSMVETVIRKELWDVGARLAELQLGTVERLLKVRSIAIAASADATPFHPANAAGTLAYQHGTFALRNEFVGDVWRVDRLDGVEATVNDALRVRVVFSNVDVACSDSMKPRPRSHKGAGAERVCMGNLFGSLPEFAPRPRDEWATFYLMVDESGAAELTRPVVERGTFTAYLERNYLSNGDDLNRSALSLHDGDAADGFDPAVVRK
ncbi:MAG: hypothetical protein U1E42_13285 [Rhodospirillales bacterium]